MNILLIGSGGREHAIAKKINESKKIKKFYCIQGNPGISQFAEIIRLPDDNNDSIIEFAKKNDINLIICGPEKPLVDGLADLAEKENIPVFGPKRSGAILEGSKIFAKNFMTKYEIPTSSFVSFNNYDEAIKYIEKKVTYPIVIKADGLASGKGVKVINSKNEAKILIKEMMINKIFGLSGESIIIEDFLIGEEMSFFYITDGKTFLPLYPAKDYKKAFDNNQGENTGGMGSYAPHTSISEKLKNQIDDEILKKIKNGFKKENIDYRGLLYVGLILTDEGPKVIEFNCRFGDPETQVILPLIENDLLDILFAAATAKLESHKLKWKNDFAACIVIASGGYPGKYKTGTKINFEINPFDFIHAGTKFHGKDIVTNGGRVLNAVYIASSKSAAIEGAYNLAKKVNFDNSFYRKDIGK